MVCVEVFEGRVGGGISNRDAAQDSCHTGFYWLGPLEAGFP